MQYEKVKWQNRLVNLKIYDKDIINAMSTMRGNPVKYSDYYLHMVADALDRNRKYNGNIWKKLQEGNPISHRKRKALMRSHRRHSKTNYNDLLASGANKKWARNNMKLKISGEKNEK